MIRFLPILLVLGTPLGAQSLSSSRANDRAAAGASLRAPPPLNVVIVTMDDVGVDQIGVYESQYTGQGSSHPDPCTPNIDQLARDGLLFTNAWASPRCSPTRSQILTGLRNRDTGIGDTPNPKFPSRVGLDPDFLTIADLAPRSAAIGKWHLLDESQRPGHPLDLGFDLFRGTNYNIGPKPLNGPSYYEWERFDGYSFEGEPQSEYVTVVTVDDGLAAMSWLEASAGGQPWLLYLNFHAAHNPWACPQLPECPATACATDWCVECAECTAGTPNSERVCETRAMVQVMDHELGRLLAAVDPTDTAVIVMGDNGSPWQATQPPFVSGHAKNTVYQGGVLVPLIARVPGMSPGPEADECHELVSAQDLFLTATDLMQIAAPPDPARDSVSLAQYFGTEHDYNLSDSTPRALVFTEMFKNNFTPDPKGNPPANYTPCFHDRAVRNATHKLIELRSPSRLDTEFYRLYDPESPLPPPHDPAAVPDPHEQVDLLDNVGSWTDEDFAAFAELTTALTLDPALVLMTGSLAGAPATLLQAERVDDGTSPTTTCGSATVGVSYASSGGVTTERRAFLDFDLSSLPTDALLLTADLDLFVTQGAQPQTSFDVVRANGPAASFAAECEGLFASSVGMKYATLSGPTASGQVHTISFGPDALTEITTAVCAGSSTLTLAVQMSAPPVQDQLELSAVPGAHALRLSWIRDPCRCVN